MPILFCRSVLCAAKRADGWRKRIACTAMGITSLQRPKRLFACRKPAAHAVNIVFECGKAFSLCELFSLFSRRGIGEIFQECTILFNGR